MRQMTSKFFLSIFVILPFFLQAQISDTLEINIANDTVWLDSNDYLVKEAISIYEKPKKISGLAGSRAVFLNGEDFWFIEDYFYYRNGNLKSVDFYYFPESLDTLELFYFKYFNKNGNIAEELCLKENPYFENKYKFYYKNGVLKEEISVSDSLYHGIYKSFYENGQLETERIYDKGNLIEVIKYFDITGKPLDVGDIGQGYGKVNIYNSKGKLRKTYIYKEGKYVRSKK